VTRCCAATRLAIVELLILVSSAISFAELCSPKFLRFDISQYAICFPFGKHNSSPSTSLAFLKWHLYASSRSHPRTFRVLAASFPRTCRVAHGHGRCGAKLSRSRHNEPWDTTMQRTLRSRVAPCDVLFFVGKHHNLDIIFISIIIINYYLLLLHYLLLLSLYHVETQSISERITSWNMFLD